MFNRTVPFSLFALIACSGDKGDGSEDTQEGVEPIAFSLSFADGYTAASIIGAEVCLLEPVLDEEDCHTTDALGLIEWTWMEPMETNFLQRLTKDGYVTTLYLGRYDDEVGAAWAETYGATGVVEYASFAFTESVVDLMLQMGGSSHQDGTGHAFFGLASLDGVSLEGAKIGLTDESGDAVGEVLYVNSSGTSFDSSLEGTSDSGMVTIANVDPGTYTLTVESSDFSCTPGRAWHSEVTNTTSVVVEADSMTMGSMLCTGL